MRKSSLPPPKIERGPYVMGVLNVTPDSFSGGGRPKTAASRGLAMLEAGADIIDIGGESTRPGALAVDEREEIARVLPAIGALRKASVAPISIDTMKPAVAAAAFEAGADIWNDVAALSAPGALKVAGRLGGPVVLMHMAGDPRSMQINPSYDDVVADVIAFLRGRVAAAEAAGVREIWVDPGIGFGKTLEHNLVLLNAVGAIGEATGRPVLVGASRKSFIGKIDAKATNASKERLGGSLAAALIAAQNGASMVRVHDVAETVQALKVWRALEG